MFSFKVHTEILLKNYGKKNIERARKVENTSTVAITFQEDQIISFVHKSIKLKIPKLLKCIKFQYGLHLEIK